MRVSILTLFVVISSIQSPFTYAEDDDAKVTGITVRAICGRGCVDPNGTKPVYALTEDEFREYTANTKTEIQPKGKTPLALKGTKPGVYFVGIEAVLDTSIVKLKSSGFPPRPARPDHAAFFADDSPEAMTTFVRSSSKPNAEGLFEVNFGLTKWYKVIVADGQISPVVALFLEKTSDPVSWHDLYPKTTGYRIALPPNQQAQFWDFMNDPGAKTPTISANHRKVLSDLLTRGGKVCLPEPERGVVWLDSAGRMQALRKIPRDKIANPTLKGPAVTITTPSPAKSENGSEHGLPSFDEKMPNGINEVRVRNPNSFQVHVGLRRANSGADFTVKANDVKSVHVPDGTFDIYFVYSNQPKALFKGDGFSLKSHGIEIQIVSVVNGNYEIRRVK